MKAITIVLGSALITAAAIKAVPAFAEPASPPADVAVSVVKTAQMQQQLSLLKIEGRLDEGVIRDVKQTQSDNKKQDERIDQHDERLRALERVTPVK